MFLPAAYDGVAFIIVCCGRNHCMLRAKTLYANHITIVCHGRGIQCFFVWGSWLYINCLHVKFASPNQKTTFVGLRGGHVRRDRKHSLNVVELPHNDHNGLNRLIHWVKCILRFQRRIAPLDKTAVVGLDDVGQRFYVRLWEGVARIVERQATPVMAYDMRNTAYGKRTSPPHAPSSRQHTPRCGWCRRVKQSFFLDLSVCCAASWHDMAVTLRQGSSVLQTGNPLGEKLSIPCFT